MDPDSARSKGVGRVVVALLVDGTSFVTPETDTEEDI